MTLRKTIRIFVALFVLFVTFVNPFLTHTSTVSAEETSRTYADGEYDVPFTVLNGTKDEASMADQYFQKPAKVVVENGELKVKVEYNPFITELKVNNTAVNTTSQDNGNIVAEFPVSDLENVVNAEIHVIVSAIGYDHWYDVRFDFDGSNIPSAEIPEEQEEIIADGNYTIEFQVWKDSTDEPSSLGNYLSKPAQLVVENQKKYMVVTLSSSQFITAFKTEFNGQLVDAEIVKEDTENQLRTLKFPIEDLTKVVNTHLTMSYGMTHEVRIIPDKNTLTVVSDPSEEEQTPGEEEQTPGEEEQTPGEEEQTPGEEEQKPGEEEQRPGEEEQTPGEEEQTPGEEEQTPGEEEQTPEEEETDNGILKDGEYTVDYSVLHGTENEPSMADSYFTKPGKLIVKNGEIVAQVEMQSENIKELQVQSQPVKIVSSNETTQVVEFPVKDIFNPVNARIHVVVESINYDHWYDIRFQFDTSDLPIADNETGGQKEEPNNDDGNNDSASGNDEDSNKDDSSNTTDEDLNYDRNGDQDSTSETNTDTNGSVINAKTGDTAQIMLYVALMIVSFVIIARKYRTRTL